jgi:hypothetical protein
MDQSIFKVITSNIYKGFTNETEKTLPEGDERFAGMPDHYPLSASFKTHFLS